MDDRQRTYREAEAARQRERMWTELLPSMAAAGVDAVEVRYNGSGDSCTAPMAVVSRVWPLGSVLRPAACRAVEAALVALLDAERDGWWGDESLAAAVVDVAGGTIRFAHPHHRLTLRPDPFEVSLSG